MAIAGAILLFRGAAAISLLRSNGGWIDLNAALESGTDIAGGLEKELNAFSQAIGANAGNKSAWFGLGMTYALQQKTEEAVSSWINTDDDPATLLSFGLDARRKGEWDVALTQFRAADEIDASGSEEGLFLAGTICQHTLASQSMLSESNLQYCADYWLNNHNNLAVNGSFSTGSSAGWGGEHFFGGKNAARLSIETSDKASNFAARLVGLDDSNHFGLSQRLFLNPGERVRFSGRFKLSDEKNLAARILYISWQTEDGTIQGNHGELRGNSLDWTEFERTFTVPENAQLAVDFYPVLFSGEGAIWIDDIRLELINE